METRQEVTRLEVRRPSRAPAQSGLRALGFVSVPGWFTVAAARKVAQAKNVPFVVVEEAKGRFGAVSVTELAGAPDAHLVSRWVRRSPVEASPQMRRQEALAVMEAAGTQWLPVRMATVLLGVVTRQSLLSQDDGFADDGLAAA